MKTCPFWSMSGECKYPSCAVATCPEVRESCLKDNKLRKFVYECVFVCEREREREREKERKREVETISNNPPWSISDSSFLAIQTEIPSGLLLDEEVI